MSLDEFKEALETAGYRTSDNPMASRMNECQWIAYRRSNLEARSCECNDDKPGMQLVVEPSQYSINGTVHRGVEVELRGEAAETWWTLKAYALKPETFFEQIDGVERRLIAAWNALEVE